jgi:type IV pilus assembly protein PilY1
MAASSLLAAGAFAAAPARAQQQDINPPKPNVLLLVDNSGSMERMIDGSLPEDTASNTCDVTCSGSGSSTTCSFGTGNPPNPNRWNILLNTLVGSATNGFHCIAMPRDPGSTFAQEYQINAKATYDTGYYLKYHRPVAKDTSGASPVACTYAPGDLPGAAAGAGVGPSGFGAGGSADTFPSNGIVTRPYGRTDVDQTTGHTANCLYQRFGDGALPAYQDILRFGLMTFDNDTANGTGVTSTGSPFSVTTPAFDGMWSYFPFWNGTGGTANPATGNPVLCGTTQPFDVGARNPAAPPWEGRMVPFPPFTDATSARDSQNQQIQAVLSATRPYGGTPIAGMFADALTYLWNDPNGPGDPINGDPYVACGGRKEYIILLTDGAPNLDLRPSCEGLGTGTPPGPAGVCPYPQPETTVAKLLTGNASHPTIETFVIGFALSSGLDGSNVNVDCSTLDPAGTDCAPGNVTPALAPCCELQKIAVNGQPTPTGSNPTPHAFFVNTATDLQAALAAILATISYQQTTRSLPAYSSNTTNINYSASSTQANQESFSGSFMPGGPTPNTSALSSVGTPWTGDIIRNRYLCSSGAQTPIASAGDFFAADLAIGGSSRHFISFLPSSTPSLDPSATIRPYAASTVQDGLGNYGGTQYADSASGIVNDISPTPLALGIKPAGCPYSAKAGSGGGTLTDTQCATMLLDFTLGQSFTGGPANFPFVDRSGTNPKNASDTGAALAFGGLFHASPVPVGPPSAALHDDSYDLFRASIAATKVGIATPAPSPAVRDNLVYTATTDGLLHAFWSDVSSLTNNEEWAFLPPAVMPQLQAAYPGSNLFLLDGTPIVKDVVWDRQQGASLTPNKSNPWRTTLVASFGPSQQGFYALDVTSPTFADAAASALPPNAPNENILTGSQLPNKAYGPVFLWQLTKVPSTNVPLFGAHGATPAITQVAITESDGNVHEVGVAILPGGLDKTPTSQPKCPRYNTNKKITDDWGPTAGGARADVRCWGSTGTVTDYVVGRSVTVVRLDTGEVLATFMRKDDTATFPNDTLLKNSRIVDTALDSPMTGTPAVYPSMVGTDALRFFVADIDGTIWRFDISNSDPTKWKGKLFYDLYGSPSDSVTDDWASGQPVALPLVTSLDRQGRVVVHAASGSQDNFDQTGPNNLVSLTETVSGTPADFHASVNWYIGSPPVAGANGGIMDVGERVSGPMTVFNGTLYYTTFSAGSISASACSPGDARLWEVNYLTANTAGLPGTGGDPLPSSTQYPRVSGKPYEDLSSQTGTSNVVIPGITIQQTTACAQTSTSSDQYVPGASHASTTSFTSGGFSMIAKYSKPGSPGGLATFSQTVPTPTTPTVIDSWAAVTE